MKTIKQAARLLFMILLVILAVFGIGLTGNFLANNREKYMDNEMKIEKTEKKEEDENDTQAKD
jgi:predicted RND superfamily exporter protein